MRTACLLWVGCEAKIAGFRPSYYATFDSKTQSTPKAEQARIDDVVALLRLPAADRPHFIAVYYSEPDHEGHEFGPDARETREAALRMDALVGKLRDALQATGLPIDLVVVSDHGMVKSEGDWINLDQFADLAGFDSLSATSSTARPRRIARASITSSRRPRRNSWFTAARMFQPA